jgi:hypothetical protein
MLLQTITAAKIQAARTIWSYWCCRFKHNTLWQLIDRTRKLRITNEDTSTMGWVLLLLLLFDCCCCLLMMMLMMMF